MRNRPDGAAAKNRVFRGFAATGGTDFELIRYNKKETVFGLLFGRFSFCTTYVS